MKKEIDINQLEIIAKNFATQSEFPRCFCLWGDLGVGKTTFSKFFIQSLIPKTSVNSPTFNINQIYDTPKGQIWHWDLYRLKNSLELIELNFLESVHNFTCLIEWCERAEDFLPKQRIDIYLKITTQDKRTIEINDLYHSL